jgi:hypothetical protein
LIKYRYVVDDIKDIQSNKISSTIETSDFFISFKGVRRNLFDFHNIKMSDDKFIFINNLTEKILKEKLNSIFFNFENKTVIVCIDISLVSRKVLSDIISILAVLSINKTVVIRVIYSLAKYAPPSKDRFYNNLVKPVSSFFRGWAQKPGMPVMTVVGIGYERDKAIGAIEYLESSKTMVYIPNSTESDYRKDVLSENSDIVSSIGDSSLIDYTVERPSEIIYSLDTVISANKSSFKTVLLPFGPKIFFAASLVSAIAHPEISVWYVSGEEKDFNSSQDREIVSCIGFSCTIKVISP